MKKYIKLNIAMALTLCLCTSTAVFAADGSWIYDGSSNWSVSAMWDGGIIADGVGSVANFTNAITAGTPIGMSDPRTVGTLNLADGDGSANAFWWFDTGPITLDNGGSKPVIDVDASLWASAINANLSGVNGFNKTGSKPLRIYDSSISGEINVQAGRLEPYSLNSLQNVDSIVVDASGALVFGASCDVPAHITCGGGEWVKTIYTENIADMVINFNSNVVLQADGYIEIGGNNSVMTFNKPISGSGKMRFFASNYAKTIRLDAPCTYTGDSHLYDWTASPTLDLNVNYAIPKTSLHMDQNAVAVAGLHQTLDLNSYTQEVHTLNFNLNDAATDKYIEITGNDDGMLLVTNTFTVLNKANNAHVKITGGTVIASGSHSWIGSRVEVTNATLLLNVPDWNGTALIDVQNGGKVGGSDPGNNNMMGALTVRGGGTAAPGSSIGTLRVAGNVTMEAGSMYEWQVGSGTTADWITVGGTLDVSGGITVNAIRVLGSVQSGSDFYNLFWDDGLSINPDDITMNYGTGLIGPLHPSTNDYGVFITGIVPEPATLGLLSLLGLAFLRRK